jgi:hypothetical protein
MYWFGGNGMKPKYSAGNKIRIKSHDLFGRTANSNISLYENMTGEIIEATNVVAFIAEPWANTRKSGERINIYHYTVKINDQIILHDVIEDYLEIVT